MESITYTPTEQDKQLVKELTDFFDATGITYEADEKVYGLFYLNDKTLQVRYVNSYIHRQDKSKRFGGEGSGVPNDYFAKISQENHKNGIRTIWIFDFEMMQTNPGTTYRRMWEVLKNYIRTATGHINHRFYARDCEVREVDNYELRPFLETNCFYGYRSASKNIGLYLKKDKGDFKAGTLLMVYTFGYNYYGNKGREDDPFIEIIRVATVIGCQVIGGASKCLKHFLVENKTLKMGNKEYPVNELRYYSDASHNSGQSLQTMGFDFVSWKDGGFMNILQEDLDEVYVRPDGNKVTIRGKKGDVQQRKPAAHKRIMELMAEGKIISVGNAGTSVWKTTRVAYLGLSDEEVAAEQSVTTSFTNPKKEEFIKECKKNHIHPDAVKIVEHIINKCGHDDWDKLGNTCFKKKFLGMFINLNPVHVISLNFFDDSYAYISNWAPNPVIKSNLDYKTQGIEYIDTLIKPFVTD